MVEELRVGGLRIQAGAHEYQLFDQTRKFRIDGDGQRQVGHRAAGVERDLVGIFADDGDQEMRGVFVGWFGCGRALGHVSDLVRRMIEPGCPRAHQGYGAILLLP